MKTKVIKIYEPGSVDVLKIEEVEIDKPGLNEVLIEHSYAGLNFIDINQRRGTYPLKNSSSNYGDGSLWHHQRSRTKRIKIQNW